MRESTTRRIGICLLVAGMLLMCEPSMFAQQNSSPLLQRPENLAISPPLRDLAKSPLPLYAFREEISTRRIPKTPSEAVVDPVEQNSVAAGSNFSVGLNFLGLGNGFPGFTPSSNPPDTSMAVGDTQIVQWTDPVFAVFDKSSGAIQAGPILGDTLWSTLGGRCTSSTKEFCGF